MAVPNKHISIRLGGIHGKAQTIVNVALRLLPANHIDYTLVSDERVPADLLIADGDDATGQALLAASARDQHAIVYGKQAPAAVAAQWQYIHPLRVQGLLDAIGDLVRHMPVRTRQAGTHEMDGVSDSCLQWLTRMRHLDTPSHAVVAPTLAIWIDGQAKTFYAIQNFDKVSMEMAACSRPPQVRTVDPETFLAATAKLQRHNLDGLIWRTAHMPRKVAPLDPKQRYRLRGWPNFTRVGAQAHELRLAALLTQRAMSVAELERASGCDQQEIAGFCNAARWFDLLLTESAAPDHRPSSLPGTPAAAHGPASSGLLARLARRLSDMVTSRGADER